MRPYSAFRRSLLLALAMGIPAVAAGQTAAPPNAAIYFINLKDGDTVARSVQSAIWADWHGHRTGRRR